MTFVAGFSIYLIGVAVGLFIGWNIGRASVPEKGQGTDG